MKAKNPRSALDLIKTRRQYSNVIMKKRITILAPLLSACLLSACSGIGLKEKSQTYAAKFTGNRASLARCVINELQTDSRWLIRGLQYEVRSYQDIEATEIYAYPYGALPGTYARNATNNPDAVIQPLIPKIYAHKSNVDMSGEASPGYSFIMTIQRTDNETVVATLNGKKYESDIAWDKLKACSPR
jgi:hypothetical protein